MALFSPARVDPEEVCTRSPVLSDRAIVAVLCIDSRAVLFGALFEAPCTYHEAELVAESALCNRSEKTRERRNSILPSNRNPSALKKQ